MHTHDDADRNDVWYETSNDNATRFRTSFLFRGEVGLSCPPKAGKKSASCNSINSERPRKNALVFLSRRKTTRSRGNSYVLFPQKLILRNTVCVCSFALNVQPRARVKMTFAGGSENILAVGSMDYGLGHTCCTRRGVWWNVWPGKLVKSEVSTHAE